jgi:hypothetical protein
LALVHSIQDFKINKKVERERKDKKRKKLLGFKDSGMNTNEI